MPLSVKQSLLIILVTAVCTFLTRLFPFALFSGKRKVPPIVNYIGAALPPAVITILVVYCVRNVNLSSYASALPQLLGIVVVALLHLWKKNNLLSIGGGTVFYMFLVQVVFPT